MQAYSSAPRRYRGLLDRIHHNLIAGCLSTKRTVYCESRAQRLRYWVLFVIACLLLLYGRELLFPLNLGIIPRATPIACAAAFLCVAGLAFAFWSKSYSRT
jgi:hypothetical protein